MAADSFWRQTPATYRAAMRGFADRRQADFRMAVAVALQQVQFANAPPKKLPKIETILEGRKKAVPMLPRQREANMGMWGQVLRAQGAALKRRG